MKNHGGIIEAESRGEAGACEAIVFPLLADIIPDIWQQNTAKAYINQVNFVIFRLAFTSKTPGADATCSYSPVQHFFYHSPK